MKGAPIIITGLQRGGTSIVGEIFERHLDVDYRFEELRRVAKSFALGTRKLPGALIPMIEAGSIRRLYADQLEEGKTLVMKDPQLLMDFGALRQIWPACRVVVVTRDPRDVACSVASSLKKTGGSVVDWVRAMRAPLAVRVRLEGLSVRSIALVVSRWLLEENGIYGPSTYRVGYETLLADPVSQIEALLAGLELRFRQEIWDFIEKISDDPDVHVCARSASLFVNDHPRRVGRWREEFTRDEKRHARSLGLVE